MANLKEVAKHAEYRQVMELLTHDVQTMKKEFR